MPAAIRAPFADRMGVTGDRDLRGLFLLIALTFAGLMLAAAPQVPDPLLRHDDFQALFNDARGYYPKTRSEGRWLNYLWLLWTDPWPAPLSFALYQGSWAVYLGALVHLAFGRDTELWRKLSVALLAGLSAPMLLISFWFNTLLPGAMVCAAYGVLCVLLPERWGRWLLVAFVPIALMGYTMNPLLLLAICLTRRDAPRSAGHLAQVLAIFVGSFALGMLLIYTLNFAYHGVFGIPMADWRTPTPAHDIASALANVDRLVEVLALTARVISYDTMPLTYVLLGLGLLALFQVGRRDVWKAAYPLLGIAMGLALIAVQAIKSGVVMPPRVLGFAFVFYAVLLGHLSQSLSLRAARVTLAGLAMLFAMFSVLQYRNMVSWQHETRRFATEIGTGPQTLFVTGTYLSIPAVRGAAIQHARALRLRLVYLTGRDVVLCEEEPQACEALPPSLRHPATGLDWSVAHAEGAVVLRLSDIPLRPARIPTRRPAAN